MIAAVRIALVRLWAGEQRLVYAFWLYFILYGVVLLPIALIFVGGAIAIAFMKIELPYRPVFGLLAVAGAAYLGAAIVGVWRSAVRYDGAAAWSILARVVVVLIAIRSVYGFYQRLPMILGFLTD